MKNRITIQELATRRDQILESIAADGQVWEVCSGDADEGYILGPASVLEKVLGLYDEEYGWPFQVDGQGSVEAFAPSHRRHPFIYLGDRLVAVSVSNKEYEDILKASS